MSEPRVLDRTLDELGLQAWLARREFREPSLQRPEVAEEMDALARIRDELRVQVALGKLEAADRFHAIEERWVALKSSADRVGHEVAESVHDLLRQIRSGYRELIGEDAE